MVIQREFLGWDRPALALAAEYLITRSVGEQIDLENLIVVVPGRRAGRRLLELLIESAEARSQVLTPPVIETVGRLPEQLYPHKRPFASEMVQQLAWAETLRQADPQTLSQVVSRLPEADNQRAWMDLGNLLRRQHVELAADGLDFSDVADHGGDVAGFDETQRWQAMFQLQQAYLNRLDDLELWDVQTARLVAIDQRECSTPRDIVLVGTVDMNVAMRQMLAQISDRVTALVFAPASRQEDFDPLGCLVAAKWQRALLPLEEAQVDVVEGPAEEAEAVARAIVSFEARYRADELTVGVLDEELVPDVERKLASHEVSARWGPGRPLGESGPCRLLAAVAAYLEGKQTADFAALIRHADFADWLHREEVGGDWLSDLDTYSGDHLPNRLVGEWLGRGGASTRLREVYQVIERLIAPLTVAARSLPEWTEPWLDLLREVYGHRQLDRNRPADRVTLAACQRLRDALQEHAQIPATLQPRATAAAAIQLALERVGRETVPPPIGEATVEMLGWLELPLDDAPALIVAGFNEGFVPSSLNSDLFLPNALRNRLGLLDNDRRYARDAYALQVLLSSRESLRLVVGRRRRDGSPLAPSRLLFATEPDSAAQRALDFFRPLGTALSPAALHGADSRLPIPRPQPLDAPVSRLSVTSFRDYLACPYRFYLRRILRLAPLRDEAHELDGAAFGTLAHEVLRRFGHSGQRESSDPDEIRRTLNHALNQCAKNLFGRHAHPAVYVQLEQLRLRLNVFADHQAQWVEQGWRIEHVEVPDSKHDDAHLPVGNDQIVLTGRIDRIDVHAETGQRIILDYKTSDTGKPPDKTHRQGARWTDLQLPLYRHLARCLGIKGEVKLGYVSLPRDITQIEFQIAPWTAAELRDADKVAQNVVQRIWDEEFWPPADPPPEFSEDLAALCQDGTFERCL